MATTQQIPAPTGAPTGATDGDAGNTQALVPVAQSDRDQDGPVAFTPPISLLPVELDVAVPVRGFRVHKLLALEPGQLIESQWGSGDDVPLATGDVQLAWCEFEVIDSELAVRITRLA